MSLPASLTSPQIQREYHNNARVGTVLGGRQKMFLFWGHILVNSEAQFSGAYSTQLNNLSAHPLCLVSVQI